MKALFFSFIISLISTIGFSNPSNSLFTYCTPPEDVTIIFQNYNSIAFDWDDCGCTPTSYEVYFVKNGQTSITYSSSTSNIAFAGLTAGRYQFYFYTVCGSSSSNIIIEETIMG